MSRAAWIIGFASVLLSSVPAVAQISSDNSTGTIVAPNGNVFEITGGTAVGGRNLFHSFDQFDIPIGSEASFLNDPSIVNVFSRVTGGKASEIDGVLRSNGTANFFLMNPSGIVFGQNASLDVGGSFVATTANGIQFGDRGSFSALPSAPSALLEVDPSAFLFNSISDPEKIEVRSQAFAGITPSGTALALGLRVPDQRSIVLVGGDVQIQDSGIYAFDGSISLGGLAASGTIGLSSIGGQFQLQFPDTVSRANVLLTNAIADVRSNGGGTIKLYANEVNLLQASALRAGIAIGLTNGATEGGNLEVDAQGQVRLVNSEISNLLEFAGTGNTGDIQITANALTLDAGGRINTITSGEGNAGDIRLDIRDRIIIQGENATGLSSTISSGVFIGATGQGGSIQIHTNNLTLLSGGFITSETSGDGSAGNITIDQPTAKVIIGGSSSSRLLSGIRSGALPGSTGSAGNILLNVDSYTMSNGGFVTSNSTGDRDAGNITINAADDVLLSDGIGQTRTGIGSNTTGSGRGGDITITGRNITLQDGAAVSSSSSVLFTPNNGDAGDIRLSARDRVSIRSSRSKDTPLTFISASSDGQAKGGDVLITAADFELTDGAFISTATSGTGSAGNVTVTTQNQANLSGSSDESPTFINTSTSGNPGGRGGTITLATGSLSLLGGASLSTSSFGTGQAGDIDIIARDAVVIRGGAAAPGIVSSLLSNSTAQGAGGKISIQARSLFLEQGGQLSSENSGSGNAGNIFINLRDIFQAKNGRVFTTATNASGGAVTIDARVIRLLESSSIATVVLNGAGKGGDITLDADTIVAIDGSDILAFADLARGQGGNIRFRTDAFVRPVQASVARTIANRDELLSLTGNSRVDINASGSVGGTITGVSDIAFLQNNLLGLSQSAIDTNALLANSCIVRNEQNGTFFITGTGGLPTNPGDLSTYSTGTVQPARPNWKQGDAIVEPQGVYQLPNGALVLSRECF